VLLTSGGRKGHADIGQAHAAACRTVLLSGKSAREKLAGTAEPRGAAVPRFTSPRVPWLSGLLPRAACPYRAACTFPGMRSRGKRADGSRTGRATPPVRQVPGVLCPANQGRGRLAVW